MTSILGIASVLAGCAAFDRCGFKGCPGDAAVTAKVHALYAQHPDLGIPGAIEVQTLNHVVYLNGMVGTGLARQEAESLALTAPGVTRVENALAVEGGH